ncbi:MAG: acetyl-CoA carboxylase biotin carboxyl carrier protein [Alphaproteobacteria bacterium]|jgi:acetyl-CoA carboxylase biotin carboxyl carrier protein|nr:Biotin-requiring enzyme [alpha proteobacterium HIMB59]
MIDKKTENSINLLIKKLKDENLGSLKFSNKTISIEISNNSGSVQIAQSPISSQPQNVSNTPTNESSIMQSIDSPMVGIIYLTPKPSSPPFVKSGQKIKKGDTICLIEAMKTFNEIKSDKDGVVKSILIKNGEAVEFGQPLFEIS